MNDREPYIRLANAIIVQAAEDYRRARRSQRINCENRLAGYELRRIKKFFRSDYFKILCDLDPECLIRHLDKEAV